MELPTSLLLAFGFTNLAMLGWLAAAAAPILIHLWFRRRYREVPWAAVEFLRAAMRSNARRIRLQQWLLLAVRTLLIVAVVLALSEPYLQSLGIAGGRGVPTHHVLVIDASLSMSYRQDGTTRLAQAKRLATELVDSSSVGDAFTLIVVGASPEVILGRPTLDKDAVRSEIAAISPTDGRADLPAVVGLIEGLVARAASEQPRFDWQEVDFFTDLTRTSWQNGVARPASEAESAAPSSALESQLADLGKQAALVVFDVGVANSKNLAVTRLESTSPVVTAGTQATLRAVVANFGDQAAEGRTVQLEVDGVTVAERQVDVPARGEATVDFVHRFTTPGSRRVAVRIGEDPLADDDTRWLAVDVKDQLRVLCVAGKPDAATYLSRALDPASAEEVDRSVIRPHVIDDGQFRDAQLSDYDCVILSNVAQLTADEASLLHEYVRHGGGLIVFLGDQVLAGPYNERLASGPAAVLPARLGDVVSPSSYGLDPLDYRHPIVAAFRGQQRAGLLTTPVFRYFQLEVPPDHPQTEVALALADGDPLIVTGPVEQGRSILVATAASLASVDAATGQPWTTLPAWPSFLPLVREMLLWTVAAQSGRSELLVGQPLAGAGEAAVTGDAVEISRPDGETTEAEWVDSPGSRSWVYDETDQSGIYAVEANQLFAVSIDPAESNLARLDRAELPRPLILREEMQTDLAGSLESSGRGPVQGWLLALALGLAFTEVGLAWLFGRGNA